MVRDTFKRHRNDQPSKVVEEVVAKRGEELPKRVICNCHGALGLSAEEPVAEMDAGKTRTISDGKSRGGMVWNDLPRQTRRENSDVRDPLRFQALEELLLLSLPTRIVILILLLAARLDSSQRVVILQSGIAGEQVWQGTGGVAMRCGSRTHWRILDLHGLVNAGAEGESGRR